MGRPEEYNFYDNNYDISSITGALKNHTLQRRNECYEKLMNYVKKTTSDGTHDYTIILRDLETTYHGMQETAVNFNSANEYRQRGFEGYGTITSEYVNNGTGESIQGFILEEMMKQNRQFQEQLWAQQREKFDLRRERWEEVTGYILNRGTRDWRVMETDFINQWRKWRFEAKREIEAGEKWWEERDAEMKGEMKTWGEETGKASSKASAEKIYNDLTGKIESYEKNIKSKMPKGMNFNIDTDKILSETMRSIPLDSIDILSKSMFETDTTAGFAEMLNLGLSSSLFKYNEQKMEEYREAVGVMKNLQVIDILNGIIENFNSQLEEANENVYDAVDISLAKNETFAEAPFMRRDAEHQWEIRVCVESNLTGDKYKTRRFTDYSYYINSTVKLQPIKGLNGATIDFTNANSYAMLDSEELETYVGLEQEELSDRIEGVFGEEGLFSDYQEGEFARLGDEFGKYYGEWMAGEALLGGQFYSKPMFPNGPNMLQTAAIAASLTGQPWAAILVAAATSGIQMADGTMTWKQAAFQVGVSAATAAIGVGADKIGNMAGAAGSFANVAAKSATMTVGNTLLSGVNLEGGSLGYDTGKMTSMKTWTSAGISMAASIAGQQYCTNDFSKALVSGVGSGLSQGVTTGDWKKSMQTGLATSVGNYLGGKLNSAVSTATGRDSFAVDNFLKMGMRKMLGSGEDFSWDTVAKNNALDNMASKYVTEAFMSDEQLREVRASEKAAAEKRQQDSEKLDFLDSLETAVGGMFLSMRDDFSSTLKDAGNAADSIGEGLKIAAGAVGDFAERTGNLFTEGHFASDEEVAEIQARERIQEAIRSGAALEEGSEEYNRVMAALYGNPRVGTGADADSTARMDEKLNSYKNTVPETANSKAVQIIKDKLASGQDVSEEELRAFFDSAEMKSVKRTEQEGKPSALENELIATIKNDPKAFEEAMKAKGLDSSNAADVQKFSREMQAGFCVLFSEYAQMTLNNVNGSAPSIGEFYKKLLNSTSSNGGQLINILSQSASTQEIFDSVAGKGNVKVVGYGKDRNGYGFEDESGRDTLNYKGSEMIDKLYNLAGDNSIKFFTVRIATGGGKYHDLTLKNNKGDLRLYDNSSRGYNVDYKKYSAYLNKNTIKSFYYIR